MPKTVGPVIFYATVMVRMPQDMHQAVYAQAVKERRSMNSQLLVVIEKWLASLDKKPSAAKVGAD
jgi:hypothetical protein